MIDEGTGNNLLHICECAPGAYFMKLTKEKTKPAIDKEMKRMIRSENKEGNKPL